ncbi:cytochrome c oxidase assembly factor Coa1 family protein [Winogradskyella sp.]|uniref:cytochrome c oxidase assembly factor Coa1 family protein n=1 Tax=Winogradskyella sp. TaxID=1883156 RepID=UPI002633036D|nr:cytochrome c oxidase assembly factor Coa1 family protein [Winogradskyella sp.]
MEDYKQKSWFARNWGWVLGGGCLVVILLFVFGVGAAIFGGMKMLKSSEPYEYAVEQASTNERLISIIGEPVETDGIMQGSLNYKNGKRSADFRIPLKGPNGKAFVYVKGEKLDDTWDYEKLYVTIKDSEERINLLDKALEGN